MSANMAEQVTATEGAASAQLFVINLCASTSPMALTHPSTPELKKHTFFVTRQREDGRERFRLHMGYFQSQQEAEALLASVRDIYPAAWAGPAPSSASAPRRMRPEAVVAAVPAAPVVVVAPAPVPAMPPTVTMPVAVARVAPAAAAPAAQSAPPTPAPPVTRAIPAMPALDAMSNVRNVLAQLSDTTPRGHTGIAEGGRAGCKDHCRLRQRSRRLRQSVTPPVARPPAPARPEITAVPAAPVVGACTSADTTECRADTARCWSPGSAALKSDAPVQSFRRRRRRRPGPGRHAGRHADTDRYPARLRRTMRRRASPCSWSGRSRPSTSPSRRTWPSSTPTRSTTWKAIDRAGAGMACAWASSAIRIPPRRSRITCARTIPKVAVVPVATRERERAGGTKRRRHAPRRDWASRHPR